MEPSGTTEGSNLRISDHELIDALISLAEMLDAAKEEVETHEEKKLFHPIIEECKEEERFSFLSGWDRLMTRFRDSCTDRNLYRVCF